MLALLLTCWTAPALAVDFVPGPPLVGDGETVHELQLQSDDPGARLRVKPSAGRILERTKVPGGLVLRYVPPAIDTETALSFEIKVAGTELEDEAGTHTRTVTALPPWAGPLRFDFSSEQASPGEPVEVTVTPALPAPEGTERDLALEVSSGTLTDWQQQGEVWTGTWTPPAELTVPTWGVFAASDRNHPAVAASGAALAVAVDTVLTVELPGATEAALTVAGVPLPATLEDGVATFSLPALPPQSTLGRLEWTDADGKRQRQDQSLPSDEHPPAVLSPLPSASLPVGTPVPMTLFAVTPSGSWTVPAVSWSGDKAMVAGAALTLGGAGPVSVDVIPTETGRGQITATLPQGELRRDLAAIDGPIDIAVSLDPVELAHDGRAVNVQTRLTDRQGAAVSRRISLDATDAQLWKGTTTTGDGQQTTRFGVSSKANTSRITAWPQLRPTGLPARHLLVLPAVTTAQANGADVVRVVLLVTDALGQPMPSAEFSLSVPVGDGFLPPTVTADRSGIAVVDFTSGRNEGLAGLRAESMGLIGGAGIWQAGGTAPPPITRVGDPDAVELAGRWQSDLGRITVTRRPKGPEVGPPATVQIAADPPYAIAGGTVTVTLVVADEKGWPVTGEQASITPTGGAFASFAAGPGQGRWTATLQVPQGWYGPIDLAAEVDGVRATARLAEVVTRRRDQPATAMASATSAPAPVQTLAGPTRTRNPRVRDPRALPTLRVRLPLLFGPTTYTSTPGGDGGEAFSPEVAYDLGAFGNVAFAPQIELWLLSGRTLGVFAEFRIGSQSYGAVEDPLIPATGEQVMGARLDVRYRLAQAGVFGAYGGLGFGWEGMPLYAWANQAQVSLERPWTDLMGARLAVGARLEWPSGWLVNLEASQLFAPFPVVSRVELTGDLPVFEMITAELGAGITSINTLWRVGESVDDTLDTSSFAMEFRIGAGVVF